MGSKPCDTIQKALKMAPVATLLGAQHYKASTGPNSMSIKGSNCVANLQKTFYNPIVHVDLVNTDVYTKFS